MLPRPQIVRRQHLISFPLNTTHFFFSNALREFGRLFAVHSTSIVLSIVPCRDSNVCRFFCFGQGRPVRPVDQSRGDPVRIDNHCPVALAGRAHSSSDRSGSVTGPRHPSGYGRGPVSLRPNGRGPASHGESLGGRRGASESSRRLRGTLGGGQGIRGNAPRRQEGTSESWWRRPAAPLRPVPRPAGHTQGQTGGVEALQGIKGYTAVYRRSDGFPRRARLKRRARYTLLHG